MSAEQLMRIERHLFLGPSKKDLHLNKHEFNIKRATVVVRPDGKTEHIAGQISHRLTLRPDDQIYYTIPFVDGAASAPSIEIDHGGVAAVLKSILSLIHTGKLEFLGIELHPENLPSIATEVSKMVEGRGWENQVGAIVATAAMIGSYPPIEAWFT